MKLYLIYQVENKGYDTYDSAVVWAPDELTARNTDPLDGRQMTDAGWENRSSTWCSSIDHVKAQYLGEAAEGAEQGLVISSFNAG